VPPFIYQCFHKLILKVHTSLHFQIVKDVFGYCHSYAQARANLLDVMLASSGSSGASSSGTSSSNSSDSGDEPADYQHLHRLHRFRRQKKGKAASSLLVTDLPNPVVFHSLKGMRQ
jgi:hypothetical protein